MSDDIAIRVNNVSKSFRLPHEKQSSIKSALIHFRGRSRGYENQHVLKDISFEIKKGEFFGIVGRNGSGKSTLLKLLAGIYTPDKGSIDVYGKLTPFIELGVGFNPELSGRENVFLNGALLGFNRGEMEARYDEIVAFAGLERFMDQKLKNYSSGMQVRLAFSIAIRTNTDILVLDEVLAVGDEAFQRKCYEYFAQLKRDKKTVILVTHSMDSVQQFCTSAFMIEKGEIVASGNPAKVAQKYRELFMPKLSASKATSGKVVDDSLVAISATMKKTNDYIQINVEVMPRQDLTDTILTLFIDRDTGEQVYRFSTDEKTGKALDLRAGKKITIDVSIQDIFPNGVFTLRASLKTKDRTKEYASHGDLASFKIDRRISSGSEWDIHWQPNEKFNISQ